MNSNPAVDKFRLTRNLPKYARMKKGQTEMKETLFLTSQKIS